MIMPGLLIQSVENANLLRFFQLKTYFQVRGWCRQKSKNGALAMRKQYIKHKQFQ